MQDTYRTPPKIDVHLKDFPTVDIIKHYGGWHEGHIELSNGSHTNGYIDKMAFLGEAVVTQEMGRRLATLFQDKAGEIDVVIGPLQIGTVLGYSVALAMGKRWNLVYHEVYTPNNFFHKSFVPQEGLGVLFVDDVISSGNDFVRYMNFIQEQKLRTVGTAVIAARNIPDLGVEIRKLIDIPFQNVSPQDCHQCIKDLPITEKNVRE